MADPLAIHTEQLVKRYGRGGTVALKGLDLMVHRGEVFGFLGPNGAGKSTTIRILLDLIRPTSGMVRVLGQDPVANPALRRDIGYLAGDFVVGGRQTGLQLLTYLASFFPGVPMKAALSLAERLNLDLGKRIGSLSKGNRQKIGVVQAFMHQPELLVLDEPTSGLDPFLQQQFVELAREAAANGQTVFMSSHVLGEVQQACDRVGIIREGTLVAVERVEDLRQRALRQIEVRFASDVDSSEFASLYGVSDLAIEDRVMRCKLAGEPDELIKTLARYHVVDLISQEPELEELFFTYYEVR